MDRIAPTPRNRLLGQLADAIIAADSYAQKPDSVMPMGKANPPLALASQFLGIGGLGRTLDRMSYGEPVTNLGKANVPLIPDDTFEAATAVGPVAGAVKAAGKGAKSGALAVADALFSAPSGKAAQRGAIRVGGDPSLMPSHNTSTESLANTLNNGTMELYTPSIGIKRHDLMSGFDGGGVPMNLIPKVGAYDPQNSTASLFNRDVYSPRWGDRPGKITKSVAAQMRNYGGEVRQATAAAEDRLDDRFIRPDLIKWLKGTEGGKRTNPDTLERVYQALGAVESKLGQAVAIKDSPAFRSFEHYESSPLGAKLLSSDPRHTLHERAVQARAFQGPLADLEPGSMHEIMRVATEPNMGAANWTRKEMEGTLRKLADEEPGLEEAMFNTPAQQIVDAAITAGRQLRQGYRKSPSEYAELKVHGATPLTSENWAGAVMQPVPAYYSLTERDEAVIKALMDAGVAPVTSYDSARALPFDHPLHPNQTGNYGKGGFDVADILQKQAGPARKQPIR